MNVECPYCKKVIEFCAHKGPEEAIRADERQKVFREAAEVAEREIQSGMDPYCCIPLAKGIAAELRKMAG